MRIPESKPRRRGKRLGWLLMLLGTLWLLALTWKRLDPLVRDIAVAEAQNAVTIAVNNAIAEMMRTGQLDYGSIVHMEKDEAGNVTAMVTDMSRVNAVKAELTANIVGKIIGTDVSDISVPLGNLIGGKLLSGRGPEVPLQIISVSRAETDLRNAFSSAGINQTLHQIQIFVFVEVFVLIPGGTVTGGVETKVTVAETVIVGRVPESYMYFENDENWDNALEQYDILT